MSSGYRPAERRSRCAHLARALLASRQPDALVFAIWDGVEQVVRRDDVVGDAAIDGGLETELGVLVAEAARVGLRFVAGQEDGAWQQAAERGRPRNRDAFCYLLERRGCKRGVGGGA